VFEKAKRHDQPFIQTIICLDGSLPLVSRADSNLMVATLHINLGKDCGFCHHVQHVIKPSNGKAILYGDLIDGSTVHTHSPKTVLLRG
jgi:hypothetical protein